MFVSGAAVKSFIISVTGDVERDFKVFPCQKREKKLTIIVTLSTNMADNLNPEESV
jgi:hypothetical protein